MPICSARRQHFMLPIAPSRIPVAHRKKGFSRLQSWRCVVPTLCMRREAMKGALITLVGLSAFSGLARGQAVPPGVDPTIARAQQRAGAGDTAGARSVLDSLLASKVDNPVLRAEAIYWLARLAASPADRERGLTALVVEYPFSPRIGPALFELGMLELSHSDRERAAVHLS